MSGVPETGGQLLMGAWQKEIRKIVLKMYCNPLLEAFKLLKSQS